LGDDTHNRCGIHQETNLASRNQPGIKKPTWHQETNLASRNQPGIKKPTWHQETNLVDVV
jgi:hypothetical protein